MYGVTLKDTPQGDSAAENPESVPKEQFLNVHIYMPPQSRPRQTQRPSQGPEASVCQMQDLPERVLQDARIATEQPLMVSPQVARLTKDLGYC